VDKNASRTIQIRERITQVITSADGLAEVSSDGQNESRFSTIEIRRSEDQMIEIMSFIITDHAPVTPEEAALRSAAWRYITDNPHSIEIPFAGDIVIDKSAIFKIREFKKFLCLIRASALLHGRTMATQEDFHKSQKLWTYLLLMMDNETSGLSKNESAVFEKIMELSKGGKRVYLSGLKTALPAMREPNIYRAIRGRTGTFSDATGGLLSKIRGMSIEKVYNKDSGETDQIIALNTFIQCIGMSPYSLELFS